MKLFWYLTPIAVVCDQLFGKWQVGCQQIDYWSKLPPVGYMSKTEDGVIRYWDYDRNFITEGVDDYNLHHLICHEKIITPCWHKNGVS